jgi:hypothetical protein
MNKQTTNTILMIEPVAFGFNDQTAINNYFQQQLPVLKDIQRHALIEFNGMVEKLRQNEVDVIVIKDTENPLTPDAVFPNNWISFHEAGQVVLYPMFAQNRRNERRKDLFQLIEGKGYIINNVDDFTFWEENNQFLEGTGSMIFDRVNKIAYAALSERTNKELFLQFCSLFEYKPVYFSANQTVNGKRLPVYHTNVMMSIADQFAVICTDCIDNKADRNKVVEMLKENGKEIITISELQMHSFAGNMLQIENKKGKRFLVLSETAYNSLDHFQIERLKFYNELIIIAIPTIEKIGGGSVRCMMAEVFN